MPQDRLLSGPGRGSWPGIALTHTHTHTHTHTLLVMSPLAGLPGSAPEPEVWTDGGWAGERRSQGGFCQTQSTEQGTTP